MYKLTDTSRASQGIDHQFARRTLSGSDTTAYSQYFHLAPPTCLFPTAHFLAQIIAELTELMSTIRLPMLLFR